MPLYYQYYLNFKENKNRLTIQKDVIRLIIPQLIIHRTLDEAFSVKETKQINHWNPKSRLELIENATYTFGINHPNQSSDLTKEMQEVVRETILFLGK